MGMDQAGALSAQSWRAQLALTLAVRGGRCVLTQRSHRGPLRVQRPFYPESDGCCHLYLLHPPAGVVGGDELDIQVKVESGARALLTTPGAGKFYRALREARLAQQLAVATEATLEWLPQEQIVYDGAQARCRTRVDLQPRANFIGWDIFCFGRPASHEIFQQGYGDCAFELWREGKPLLLERCVVTAPSGMTSAVWGMQGKPVLGTLLAVNAEVSLLELLRQQLPPQAETVLSLTLLDDLLVARYLGEHSDQARQLFQQLWSTMRSKLLGKQAVAPRIWAT